MSDDSNDGHLSEVDTLRRELLAARNDARELWACLADVVEYLMAPSSPPFTTIARGRDALTRHGKYRGTQGG